MPQPLKVVLVKQAITFAEIRLSQVLDNAFGRQDSP